METTQLTPEAPVQPEAPKRFPAAPRFQLPKKRKKWLKRLVLILAAAGILLLLLRPLLFGGPAASSGQYQPAAVQRQDLTVSVDGSGTMTPIESYQVGALVSGEILEAPFQDGDRVEKGQLLYRIDPGSAATALEQAQLAVQQAQLTYDSTADGLRPRASGSGVVQKLYVKKGDMVSAGSPIADISDTSSMTLTLPFQSADAARISVGQSAQVTLAGTLETLPGTVEYVAGADQVGSGGALVRQVKIRVNNPGALTEAASATAKVGTISCAAGGAFEARLSQTITAQAGGYTFQQGIEIEVSGGDQLVTLGGSAAETALQNAALSLQNAQLSLQSAQEVLENYTITSPISGTVIEKNLKAGDQLDGSESGALAVIYDLEQLELKMNVSELDIGKIQPGQSVEITAEALPGETFLGTVEKVNINGTTTDGFTTYPVTILLSEYGALNPGMNVSADIIVEQAQQVLCVPPPAVSGGNTVLVAQEGALGEDGSVLDPAKLETRQVELGSSSQDYVEILSGLEEGETVLVPIQSTDGSAGSTAVMASGG